MRIQNGVGLVDYNVDCTYIITTLWHIIMLILLACLHMQLCCQESIPDRERGSLEALQCRARRDGGSRAQPAAQRTTAVDAQCCCAREPAVAVCRSTYEFACCVCMHVDKCCVCVSVCLSVCLSVFVCVCVCLP